MIVSTAFIVVAALASAPPSSIEIGTRNDGTSARGTPPKRISWSEVRTEVKTLFDVQANATVTVKGVTLDALLAGASLRDADTALLHFVNGMQVPVPLDAKGEPLLDVFIAHERKREDGAFVPGFAPVIRERSPWMEQRAIVFGDNKVIVSQSDHPALAPTTTRFSPWHHVDSLKRIELVRAAKVHASLDVSPDRDVRKGLEVFEQRCQFCHGVAGKGASFGWDFVEPIPLSTWRDAESLLYHVKLTKLDGAERGLMMPPQPDATIDEMRALWAWMNAVSKHGDGASSGAGAR